MRTNSFRDYLASNVSGVGGSLMRIKAFTFADYPFPLPPLSEQKRIVSKIDNIFSRLDASVRALKRGREQIKRYRQSVLKAAVEGKLSKDWRDSNENEIEPILIQYKNSQNIIPENSLYKLPKAWIWTTMGEIISEIKTGKSFKCEERPPEIGEIGVAKVSAVSWGELNEKESKTCVDTNRIDPSIFIKNNDFLFSRANTIDLVGACVIVNSINGNIMLSDKILRLSFHGISPKWILYVLRSLHCRNEIRNLATGNQVSMRNITQDRIRIIRIPVPSSRETDYIVLKVEDMLSKSIKLEKIVNKNLKQAEYLRHSILEKAFTGKLVMQNPDEGSAEELIRRINSEKLINRRHVAVRSDKMKNIGMCLAGQLLG